MRVDNVSDSSQIFRMQSAPTQSGFIPAFPVLGLYDPAIRLLTRERAWRAALRAMLAPHADGMIVDAGCGTGTLLTAIGRDFPAAQLVGVDPDPRILTRAAAKLRDAGVPATLKQGYLRDLATLLAGRDVRAIVSSLVFHQVPMAEKRAGLAAVHGMLAPGGLLLIADYGAQRSFAMRTLFRLVQAVDGTATTQPNADGVLPGLIRAAGFADVAEPHRFATATGSISIYRAIKPA
jgi:ubiquinone/menaquinone biosynthesis C-methylase UbiE